MEYNCLLADRLGIKLGLAFFYYKKQQDSRVLSWGKLYTFRAMSDLADKNNIV